MILDMVRRGPKPKSGKRERNGQLSRRDEDVAARALEAVRDLDREQREALSTNVAARFRRFGVPMEDALDQRAGSFVGRLRMTREISAAQYHAAEMFAVEQANYRTAMASPREPVAIDLNATHGSSLYAEDEGRSRRHFHRYESSLKAVTAKQNELRGTANLYAALNLCVVQDISLPHMIGDLRLALNALVKHYGLTRPAKAA